VSDVGLGLYRNLLQPAVGLMTSKPAAEAIRAMHPNRLRFAIFSDQNPLMSPVEALAKSVRDAREPVAPDNPLLAWEQAIAGWISLCLETYGSARDAFAEAFFLNAYGSPLLQAMVGLGQQAPDASRHIERDLVREADEARMRSELETRFEVGGTAEAASRALIYVNRPNGGFDERGFAMLKEIRAAQPVAETIGKLKEVLKEQSLLVRLDEERAIQAIPKLLPKSADQRQAALNALHHVIDAQGALPEESRRRLERVDALFDASRSASGGAPNV
jgi:hypothetical protein